jgi:hypothetical protein
MLLQKSAARQTFKNNYIPSGRQHLGRRKWHGAIVPTLGAFLGLADLRNLNRFPPGGHTLPGIGLYELTGLASKSPRMEEVWTGAQLQEPPLPIALTHS